MNRDELAELIFNTLKNHNHATELQDAFVAELWPVLATAWSEGYEAGYKDGAAEQGMGWEPGKNQNPYEEVS